MKFIRLTNPRFGCSQKRLGGVYLTIIPGSEPGQLEPELYLRWVIMDDAGNVLPGDYGDRIKGPQFNSFLAAFQFNDDAVLDWVLSEGLEQGAVEEEQK